MALQRCFARHERLLQSRDFVNVFTATQCKSSDACWTVLAVRNQRQYPRLGLAITKKKISNATDRNRLKRVVRESFRHHKEQINGLDIVVLSQRGTAALPNAVLFESLHKHWRKIAQRCAKPAD